MMEKLRNPKNVKMISLIVAAIFVLGCFTIALSSGGFNGTASAAANDSAIGVVNYQVLVAQSPQLEDVKITMQKAYKEANDEFIAKSKNMNNAEKERYFRQLQERLNLKEKEMMDPLLDSVNDTIKQVADKKGLKVVVDKSTVIYGGMDITDEVAKKLQSAKK